MTDLDFSRSPWLTPEETADYLGVALGTIRNWTSQRHIPHVKLGRVVRFHKDELDSWLRSGKRNVLTLLTPAFPKVQSSNESQSISPRNENI